MRVRAPESFQTAGVVQMVTRSGMKRATIGFGSSAVAPTAKHALLRILSSEGLVAQGFGCTSIVQRPDRAAKEFG
jgi:hypothetical protein